MALPSLNRGNSAQELTNPKQLERNNSLNQLNKDAKSLTNYLLYTISGRMHALLLQQQCSAKTKTLMNKILEITTDETDRFILARALLPDSIRKEVIKAKDLKLFAALHPFTPPFIPDIESTGLDEVARLFGDDLPAMNNSTWKINGTLFRPHGTSIAKSVTQILEQIRAAGWEMGEESMEELAHHLLEERSSQITKLFQAAFIRAPGTALGYLLDSRGHIPFKSPLFNTVNEVGHPELYILSQQLFTVVHKRRLVFEDASQALASISITYRDEMWESTLFVTNVPKKSKKYLNNFSKRIQEQLTPASCRYLTKPVEGCAVEELVEKAQDLENHHQLNHKTASLLHKFLKLPFTTPDEFYIASKTLMLNNFLQALFEEFDSRQAHRALTEYLLSASDIEEDPETFLNSERCFMPFVPPLLEKLEDQFDFVWGKKQIRSFTIRKTRTAWIASQPCTFLLKEREAFTAVIHACLTHAHHHRTLRYFITQIRHSDIKLFNHHALPLFEAFEQTQAAKQML